MSKRPRQPERRPATPGGVSRPKLRNQFLFVAAILVLASGAFYTALVVATQIDQIFFPDSELRTGGFLGKLPGVDSGDSSSSSDIDGRRLNILVMGLDRRDDESRQTPGRTDTMFVLTVDPATKTAGGLGIPRDLWVDIPSKTGNTTFKERVNTAYVYGETQKYQGGGPALAKATVERFMGIKIDYYVVIDFEGFRQVIDLLQGIDVDVPTAINDPYYSETEAPGDYYPCVFAAGVRHMDGSEALCYARTRRNSNDLDRIQRQQRIMFAVMDRAAQLGALSEPTRVVRLWKEYKGAIDTDISDFQIPGFAKLAAGIDSGRVSFLSLGAATVPYTTPEGAAVLIPSEAGIKTIVDALFSDHRLLEEGALVEIQNGTARQGIATKAVDYLASLGIPTDLLVATNAVAATHTATEIIDFSGKGYTAERLAGWLGVSKDRIRRSSSTDATLRTSTADILVILGSDVNIEAVTGLSSR